MHKMTLRRTLLALAAALAVVAVAGCDRPANSPTTLRGDWDYYDTETTRIVCAVSCSSRSPVR